MYTVATLIPGPTDATSWYRGVGPFAALKRELKDVNLMFAGEINWPTLDLCDLMFMQRPFTDAHLKCGWMSQQANLPIWIDYDDNLLEVPKDNPTHSMYSDPKNIDNIKKLCGMADVITVSTESLKKSLIPHVKLGVPVVVVPNALNDYRTPLPKSLPARQRLVLWRGSPTHTRDLMTYADDIVAVAKEHPQWSFCFLGDKPWYITERLGPKQALVPDALPIDEYWDFIKTISPSIQVVPLADSNFNRCKSNIAWLEGSWAGAVAVTPAWESWKVPGVVPYEPATFASQLSDTIEAFEAQHSWPKENLQNSLAYIHANLRLSVVNEQRKKILKGFMDGTRSGSSRQS